MKLKGHFIFIVSGVFLASCLSQAAPVHWTGGAVSNDWKTAATIELPNQGTLDADFEAVTNRIDTSGKSNEFFRIKVDRQN